MLWSQGGGRAPGSSCRAEKFALHKRLRCRRPPLTRPCVLAWLHLSREKSPFSSQLSAQPDPWGLHVPEGGFLRVSSEALSRPSKPRQSCLAELQEAPDGSALGSPDPGGSGLPQHPLGPPLSCPPRLWEQTEFWEGGRVAVFLNRIHSVFIQQIFEAPPYAKACSSSGSRQNRTDKVQSLWSWHSKWGEPDREQVK